MGAAQAPRLAWILSAMEGNRMAGRVDRADYPWWVKVSLVGVPGRAGQWFFVGLSIAAAVACVVYGFWDPRFFGGVLFLFSALMYWLTIRWIDRYGSWANGAEQGAALDRGHL
jgi:hypothetical protein